MVPRTRRHTWRPGATLTVTLAAILFALSCSGIREDEFDCEGAVAHLVGCCPGFDPDLVDCSYQASQACSAPVYPDLGVTQSTCIRAESCQTLVASGVCARAAKLPKGGVTEDASAMAVCP